MSRGEGRSVQRVLVVGSGIMGRGIATSFAMAGLHCTLLSRRPELIGGLRATGELPPEPPDLVIEAIPEDMGLKLDLFKRLDAAYEGQAILASNTSSLSLQEMADALGHPEAFCGVHYFQPAESFAFAEVIEVAQTDPDVVPAVGVALARTGKQAIHLRKAMIGGLINRLQHAMLHEAGHLMDQGVVDPESIDLVARNLLGPRMCVTGVLEQKDLSGLKTFAAAQRALVPHLYHGADPSRVVQDLAEAGHDGATTGRGFYEWAGTDVDGLRRRVTDKLARILAIVREP